MKLSWTHMGGGLLVGAVLLFFFVKMVANPWQEQNRQLAVLEKELEDKQQEQRAFETEKKKLGRYRLLGLPANVSQGGSEYARYLKNLFQDSGLTVDDLQGPTGTEVKNGPQQQGKKPGHVVLTYQVRARGEWAGVVTMLEKFQRTALLHRIRSFTMERPGALSSGDKSGKLGMSMTIEALVVSKAEHRPSNLWGIDARVVMVDTVAGLGGAPTGWAMLLRGQALLSPEAPARNYKDLARQNPFVGALAPPPPPTSVAKKPATGAELDVRQYVELVMTNASEQKASLRNLLVNVGEQRRAYTTLSPRFPYDTFQIVDDEEVLVRGKVLRVDHRDVYFQVGEAIYGIHVGQNLADAMKTPLTNTEVETLGLHKAKGKGG